MIIVRQEDKLEAGDCIQVSGKKHGSFASWVTRGGIYTVKRISDRGVVVVTDDDGDENTALVADYIWVKVKVEKIFSPIEIHIKTVHDLKELIEVFDGFNRSSEISRQIEELRQISRQFQA